MVFAEIATSLRHMMFVVYSYFLLSYLAWRDPGTFLLDILKRSYNNEFSLLVCQYLIPDARENEH